MSRKSQSVAASVPTVKSRCVPRVSDRIKILRIGDAPAQVSVPVMVKLELTLIFVIPVDAGAVKVKFLIVVGAPLIKHVYAAVFVKETS